MATPEDIKKNISKVITLLNSADAANIIKLAVFPNVGKPLSGWSFSNKLMVWIDYLEHKYPKKEKFVLADYVEASEKADYRGFRQWKEKGRSVQRGAKAAYILAPSIKNFEKKTITRDGTKHNVYYDKDKKKHYSPSSGAEGREYVDDYDTEKGKYTSGFRGVPVFSVIYTKGKPLKNKEIKMPNLPYIEVAKFLKIKITLSGYTGSSYGSFSPNMKIINLASPDESVFLHELSHAVDDYIMKQKTGKGLKGGQQIDQEVVAEFTAFVLGSMAGLDMKHSAGFGKKYIEGYSGKSTEEAIVKLISRIEKIVDFITNFKGNTSAVRKVEIANGEPAGEAEKLADKPPAPKGLPSKPMATDDIRRASIKPIGGKTLFVDDDGKDHTELDYCKYFLKNNTISEDHIKQIKKGNKKVLGAIPHKIWLQALKEK